jgi:hypothetical protein
MPVRSICFNGPFEACFNGPLEACFNGPLEACFKPQLKHASMVRRPSRWWPSNVARYNAPAAN